LRGNTVSILKNGRITNIAEEDLTKGDILLLQAGDLVSADLKLLEAHSLEVDEFELTGEIRPADKKANGEDVLVYRGSKVIRGNGKGVVVATGEATEYGEIIKQRWGQVKLEFPSLINGKYSVLLVFFLPPFIVSLTQSINLALVCVTYFSLMVLVVLLQNSELFRYILTMREVKKIESQGIHIQDVTSLDRIKSVNIFCFDKTGVLTTRDLEVERIHFADAILDTDSFASAGHIYDLAKIACALCNGVIFFEKASLADSIDRALIAFAMKNGINVKELLLKSKRIYEKPFDSENRYMACGFELEDGKTYFAKGDPEIILRMCQNYTTVSGIEKELDFEFLSSMNAETYAINQKGDIAIALAYNSNTFENPPLHWTFLCLLQLENPVKTGISDVVKTLQEGGIRTLILTGDRPETALKISREVGIEKQSGYCLSGKSMARMDLSEVARQSDYVSVFARLLPSQKGVLIMLLQQRNNVVAMVGDGPNDTVALKVADVGISFVENSSPFAQRVSKILINDLADLLAIIRIAGMTKLQVRYLLLFRILALISVFFVLYVLMLS
jgi:Ca2+-transporting ATPase